CPIDGCQGSQQEGDWGIDNVADSCNSAVTLSFNVAYTDEVNRFGDVDCFKFTRGAGLFTKIETTGADCSLHRQTGATVATYNYPQANSFDTDGSVSRCYISFTSATS